jgi:DNA modification methylase
LIVYQSTEELVANPHNSRTHSKRQIRQIAESIRTFGFTNPILITGENVIIAGHGRMAAARLLGIDSVPTIRIENLSPDQIRAYILADNRLAEIAGWDHAILAIELQHLVAVEANFDVTITGFEVPEIDLILRDAAENSDPDDEVDIAETGPAVTQPGEMWHLEKHRVLCASALRPESYVALLGKKRANVVFLDPPYNVAIDGHATGNGSIHHREFQMASGEMSEAEFVSFLSTSLRLAARYSLDNSIHYICMDWRHMAELLAAGRPIYDSFLNLCVWAKDKGGMGSLYRSQHELIFVFRNGKGQHRNNIQLGQYGRNRTNVWNYPGVNTLSKQGDEPNLLSLHPTVKPVALVADSLLDCSARGDIVLDSFLGSGSTLIAAERVGRVCHGMEIDPLYVDGAIRRWQRHTGNHAIHAVTGNRFDDCAPVSSEVLHAR